MFDRLEAERILIGAMLASAGGWKSMFDWLLATLTEGDFTDKDHAAIFKAIIEQKKEIGAITMRGLVGRLGVRLGDMLPVMEESYSHWRSDLLRNLCWTMKGDTCGV